MEAQLSFIDFGFVQRRVATSRDLFEAWLDGLVRQPSTYLEEPLGETVALEPNGLWSGVVGLGPPLSFLQRDADKSYRRP